VAQLGKVGRNRRSLGGSAACAIAVFLFGILQYRSSENWKRSEFVAAQIKECNSHKINHAVLLMMDYDRVARLGELSNNLVATLSSAIFTQTGRKSQGLPKRILRDAPGGAPARSP
jgi:hypothetical protein